MSQPVKKTFKNYTKGFIKSKGGFYFFRVIIATFIYVLFFHFMIMPMERNWEQWIFIIFTSMFSSIMGAMTARIICGEGTFVRRMVSSNYKDPKDFQYFMRFFIIGIVYGSMVWMLIYFNVFNKLGFGWLLIIFLVAKGVIFFVSDFIADRLSFSG